MFSPLLGMYIGMTVAMIEKQRKAEKVIDKQLDRMNTMASWKNRSLKDCVDELARLKRIRGKQQGVLNNIDTQLSWLNTHIESKTPLVMTYKELEEHFGKPVVIRTDRPKS